MLPGPSRGIASSSSAAIWSTRPGQVLRIRDAVRQVRVTSVHPAETSLMGHGFQCSWSPWPAAVVAVR
jgi:hypothetical protein